MRKKILAPGIKIKAFTHPIFPSAQAEFQLLKFIEASRLIYNLLLAQRKQAYRRVTLKHAAVRTDGKGQQRIYRKGLVLSSEEQSREITRLIADQKFDMRLQFDFKIAGKRVLFGLHMMPRTAINFVFSRLDQACDATEHYPAKMPQFLRKSVSFGIQYGYGVSLDGEAIRIAWNESRIPINIPVRFDRPLLGKLCGNVIIRRAPTGKWYATFQCESPEPHIFPQKPTNQVVGVDVGVKVAMACVYETADGKAIDNDETHPATVPNQRWLAQSLPALRKAQREHSGATRRAALVLARSGGWQVDSKTFAHALSVKQAKDHKRACDFYRAALSSKRAEKRKQRIATLHEHVANARRDWNRKLALKLIRENDVIVVEKLLLQNLVRRRKADPSNPYKSRRNTLAKAILDVGHGQRLAFLKEKAAQYGKRVIEVSARNTSKECSRCGEKKSMPLSVRVYICKTCGHEECRDVNAARVILHRGLALMRDEAAPDTEE